MGITFRIIPDSATVVVDGRELAPGVVSIPHVAAGETHSVVVRAAGYQDEVLQVDDTVSGSVDVVLTLLATDKAASPPDDAKKRHKGSTLPANPY
jgi:hypothetical protein